MQAIRNVFAALSNLAASLNGPAGVLDVAMGRLRPTLALDGEAGPVLEHNAVGGADSLGTNGATKGRRSRAGA